jgi:hypothetical protein
MYIYFWGHDLKLVWPGTTIVEGPFTSNGIPPTTLPPFCKAD